MTVTAHPSNTTKCTGETAAFICEAEGNFSTISSQNVVLWKRLTQSGAYERLVTGPKYSLFESFDDQFGSLTHALKIKNVTTDDEGWYVLEVGSDVMSNGAYMNVVTAAGTVYTV